ncbi:MAG TPA: alpha/beta hydrolase [Burkholderiales bacterium]|nr:alpha/beta hydrolase [Burkholderiales bacterium]
MTVSHQTGVARSGDLALHYRRLGHPGGTPLVFVHGLSFFSWDWLEAAQALAGDREAACMDMRGFGDSGRAADYSVPAMAGDIGTLMDHFGWPRAIVVGHSMGGRSSAYFAAKNPSRVAALVLVDYSPDNAPAGSKRVAQSVAAVPDAFATIEEAMAHFKADPKDAKKRARFEAYLAPVPGGLAVKRDPHFRDQFRKTLATGERPKLGVDMWQALAELRSPTLVIRGARSDIFLPETVDRVTTANPRIRVAEVDAGHNVAGDNLAGFLAAVRPFLASLEEKSHEHARS